MKLAVSVNIEDDPIKHKETVNKIFAKKNAPNFEELKAKYKKSVSTKNSPMHKAKADAKEIRQDSRYRLISQKRALKIDELEDWPGTKESEGSIIESNNDKGHFYFSQYLFPTWIFIMCMTTLFLECHH